MRVTKVYFMLWVADMDRASRFYKSALGLDEAYRSPSWTELRFGDATIGLHAGASQLPHHHIGLGFEVDDLAGACAAVTAAGGEVVAGPAERPDEGIVVADCADPDGNRFSLARSLP
jgi:predicted enzyme related to lactoylglutathione lyase